MVCSPQMEMFIELEDIFGYIHPSENSPSQLETGNEKYLRKSMEVFL